MLAHIAALFFVAGTIFAIIAAVGVVRLPDLYCRMHAATKAGAFGASLLILGTALLAQDARTWVQGIIVILFFYLTAPVAAQMIGRAGFLRGAPLWEKTRHNELGKPGEVDLLD